jgi:hypothetical protein
LKTQPKKARHPNQMPGFVATFGIFFEAVLLN